jgi:hypothetical protein
MSNSVFLFITGLTLGILISMSLISRYQHQKPTFLVRTSTSNNEKADMTGLAGINEKVLEFNRIENQRIKKSKGISDTKSLPDSSTPDDSVENREVTNNEKSSSKTATEPKMIEKTEKTTEEAAIDLPHKKSFWIPGKEGAFLSFKNNKEEG